MEKRAALAAATTRAQPRLLLETAAPRRSTAAFPSVTGGNVEEPRTLETAPLAVAFAFAPLKKRGVKPGFALARGK